MGEVMHRPIRQHHCRPGWTSAPLSKDSHLREQGWESYLVPDHTFNAAPGTVWRCDCGRVWVARLNHPGRLYARWVPESRFAQWRRQRRERTLGGCTTMSDLTTRLRELEGLQLNERQCWTIKETATHLVEVIPMIFNDRLVLTPKATPDVYDHGWCYDQGGPAVLAALAWDPDAEAEPVGYKKRATPHERVLVEKEGSGRG